MKKSFYQIILLLIIFVSALKADINSSMQAGNEFYKNNQYQLAIDEYDKLINKVMKEHRFITISVMRIIV